MSYTEPTFCTDCHEPTSLCQCGEPVARPSYSELAARLAEAERMLEDIDGRARIGDLDMNQIRAAIGTFLYRTPDSATVAIGGPCNADCE
jgi:hypothetical protein